MGLHIKSQRRSCRIAGKTSNLSLNVVESIHNVKCLSAIGCVCCRRDNKEEKYLLSGGNLGEAEGWFLNIKYKKYLSDLQRTFIWESLQKENREKEDKLQFRKLTIKRFFRRLIMTSVLIVFAGFNWVKAEISSTQEKLNNSVDISEKYFNLQDYRNALFEAIKAQQLLDNTWWRQWMPAYIKQKVKTALDKPINHSWVDEKHTLSQDDRTVKLWNGDNGQLLYSLEGHKNLVNKVRFSSDGKVIASASVDKTVKLWYGGQLVHSLEGHKHWVFDVRFSPDSKVIASASADKTVKLWNVNNAQLVHSLEGHKHWVFDVRFSPDGKVIASVSGYKTVKLWNVNNGQLLHSLEGHKHSVDDVKFSSNSKVIASASMDGKVKLWNVNNGQLLHSLEGHKDKVFNVKFSPNGKVIASASGDKTVKLWNVNNGQSLHSLEGHKNEVTSVIFSPNGKVIASVSGDKTVKLWNVNNGQLLHSLEGHKNEVTSVVFSPNGKVIASVSGDKTVKLWNVNNGQLLHSLEGHKDEVKSVVFSPDGKTIASASADGTIKLWNWDFDNLITRGCNRLKYYFVERPEKLEELKACQNPEILAKAASTLIKQGEQLVKNGESLDALEKFKKAKEWNPKLDINPEEKSKIKN